MNRKERIARTLAFISQQFGHPDNSHEEQSQWALENWQQFPPLVADDLANHTDTGRQELQAIMRQILVSVHKNNSKAP